MSEVTTTELTVEEWFSRIADPELRQKAQHNQEKWLSTLDDSDKNTKTTAKYESLYEAFVDDGFPWIDTVEGGDYWAEIAIKTRKGEIPLLDLPVKQPSIMATKTAAGEPVLETESGPVYVKVLKNTTAPWLQEGDCYEAESISEEEDGHHLCIMGFTWVADPKHYKKLPKGQQNYQYVTKDNYQFGDRVIPSDKWNRGNEADGSVYGYILAPNPWKSRPDKGDRNIYVQWVNDKEEPISVKVYPVYMLYFYIEQQ